MTDVKTLNSLSSITCAGHNTYLLIQRNLVAVELQQRKEGQMTNHVAGVKGQTLSIRETCKPGLIQEKSAVPHSLIIPQRACGAREKLVDTEGFCPGRDTGRCPPALPPSYGTSRKATLSVGKEGESISPAKNRQGTSRQHLATLQEGRSRLLEGGDPFSQAL